MCSLACKKKNIFKVRTNKTHRFTCFVALEYCNLRKSLRSYFSELLWLSEMPIQCCIMWFKTYSSVLGKAVVKDYYLELCFKIWRILIWMTWFGTVIYMSLSCETFPQLLMPACKWAVWSNSTEANGGTLPPLRMWLLNMLSDEMPLSFTLSISHAKAIFFPVVTMRSYIYAWASGLSLIEKKISLITCSRANMKVFQCRVSGRNLESKLVYINVFFLYHNEGIINCNNKLQGLW